MMSWLVRGLIAGVVLYGAFCLLLFLAQRKLMFPAPGGSESPDYGMGERTELVELQTAEGAKAVAMVAAAREGLPTAVVFHGNGEDIRHQGLLAQALAQAGWGFAMVEYPGYSLLGDQGPTEQGLYACAEAALKHLREQGVGPERTLLLGRSLGTGVAVEMAVRGHAECMVLVAPFTSMTDMARKIAPFAPVGWLVRDRFDSLSKAPRVTIPVLVIHGDRDGVIPYGQGERLAEALPAAIFQGLEGVGHNDLSLAPGSPQIQRILQFGSQHLGQD